MNWPMEPYLRAKEIEAGAEGYNDFYGLQAAYNAQFEALEKTPEAEAP